MNTYLYSEINVYICIYTHAVDFVTQDHRISAEKAIFRV